MSWYYTEQARRDAAKQTEWLMKKCQIGVNNLEDAHNVLAMCYGHIGRQAETIEKLKAELSRMRNASTVTQNSEDSSE